MNSYNVHQQPPSARRTKPIILYVDSLNDSTKDEYTVDFSDHFRDVISIELIKAVIPNPDSDNYVILTLDNISHNGRIANTSALSSALCTVEQRNSSDTKFIYHRTGESSAAHIIYLDQPIRLSSLKIKLRRPSGGVPSYGSANHFLAFEINTLNQPMVPFRR